MTDNISKGFTLSELITSTANDLREARKTISENPVMQFRSCELELAVTVKGEAGGGIRFWVVEATAKIAAETVSKVKLSFDSIPDRPSQFLAEDDDSGPGPAA